SVGAGTWKARRADLGAAAEDHRLFQRDLGRCRRRVETGRPVASARGDRYVWPSGGSDRARQSPVRADRAAGPADAGDDDRAAGRTGTAGAGALRRLTRQPKKATEAPAASR